MTTKEYINKWLAGTLSESEQQAFEKTQDFQELRKLDQHIKQFRAPAYESEMQYANLIKKLPQKTKVVSVKWMQPLLKVAAAVLMVIISYVLYDTFSIDRFQTETAAQSEIFLPDSSRVILNAQSDINYSAFNWQKNRSLQLQGEAFFEVAKGSNFDVKTKLGTVTVVGTKFNVISRRDYFEVVCFEGKVQVKFGDRSESITSGIMFRAINNEIVVRNIRQADGPSWILNESSFSSMPYAYVIDELSRQYDVTIKADSVNTNTLFTGSFVHDDLELALKAITRPLNLEFDVRGKEIILTSEN
ncbi:MAG: transmembrane sensor [Marivirga sp.]|jgi:ferric-dicitrate binding protein FerR (iron transport regulator)